MIRVFLLDDHEVVRAGLRELLQHDGDIEVVGESASALEAARRIPALRPDVAGHLDLIRRNAPPGAVLDSPAIRKAADRALEAIRAAGAVLDLNTAGYRKGLGSPYPAPWLVQRAHAMDIGFCFGDDSHGPADVGAGIDEARQYLLDNGVPKVTVLTRDAGAVVKRQVSLDD